MDAMQFIPTKEQLETLKEIAQILIASNLYKIPLSKGETRDLTMNEALAKILRGLPLGLTPSESLEGIIMLRGKLAMSAGLMGTLMKKAGYDWVTETLTDTECKLVFYRNGLELGISEFSIADAKKAGIVSDMYNKFPRNMLMARAISNAAKWFAQDAFGGAVYTPDELGEDKEQDSEKPHNPRRLAQEPPQTPKTQPGPIVDAVAHIDENGELVLPEQSTDKQWKATAQFIQTRGYADKVMKLTDEARRAIVADFTKGRTNSMRELSDSDLKDLYDLLTVEYRGLQYSTVWQTKGRAAMAKSASGQRTDNLWHLEGIEIETVLANMHHKIEKSQAKEITPALADEI